jgi:transcription initiation factor IIE alpha subunit
LRKSDELNAAARSYFEELKQHLVKSNQSSFTSTSIRNQLRIPVSSVKRYHAALMDAGLIKQIENRNTKAYHYEIIAQEEYAKLQSSIATALDEALQNIQQPTSPTPAQKKNELRKRKPVKELEEQPTAL